MNDNENIKLLNKFLEGNCNREEMKQLNRILDNPNQLDDWMFDQWDTANTELDSRVEKKMYEVINRERKKKGNVRLFHFWKIASVVLLFIISGLSAVLLRDYLFAIRVSNKCIVNVDRGQKASMVLPDGTKVWINSDSKITYDANYNRKDRIIELNGEAYFEVEKNEHKPFVVKTTQMSVKALGTSFNVKAYEIDEEVTTTLFTGKVQVATWNQTRMLAPHQRLTYNKQSHYAKITDEPDHEGYPAWRNNQFVFNNEKFESIANTLKRYYNIDFVFEDERLKNYCFTGAVPNTSLESLLEIFSITSPLKYELRDSTIILNVNKRVNKYYDPLLN